jgi:hypothetical protein
MKFKFDTIKLLFCKLKYQSFFAAEQIRAIDTVFSAHVKVAGFFQKTSANLGIIQWNIE